MRYQFYIGCRKNKMSKTDSNETKSVPCIRFKLCLHSNPSDNPFFRSKLYWSPLKLHAISVWKDFARFSLALGIALANFVNCNGQSHPFARSLRQTSVLVSPDESRRTPSCPSLPVDSPRENTFFNSSAKLTKC